MKEKSFESWGRFPHAQSINIPLEWSTDPLPLVPPKQTVLPFGLGRSYGDSCLNHNGTLLTTRKLDHFLSLDLKEGVLRCEAGVSFAEILQKIVPLGWFLPVTPGTQFITVGGAIANDVHGKNHHVAGTFGRYVRCFELLRSDGSRMLCSPSMNQDWYAATIGGLGLTGLISWAEIKLKSIASGQINQELIKQQSLDEFFDLSLSSEQTHEYTVSWIDCLASGKQVGKGLFIRGNHAQTSSVARKSSAICTNKSGPTVPIDAPGFLLNPYTLKIFNFLYFHKQFNKSKISQVPYSPFFYPLDAIQHWNRIYGSKGFLQYQFVVPYSNGREAIHEILSRIAKERMGSFLAVLKTFSAIPSPGLLSFPRPGVTLALDFPNHGKRLFDLLDSLDEIVAQSNGAVYPAKDARMKPERFQKFFPKLEQFMCFIDPKFSSSFWRRVHGNHL